MLPVSINLWVQNIVFNYFVELTIALLMLFSLFTKKKYYKFRVAIVCVSAMGFSIFETFIVGVPGGIIGEAISYILFLPIGLFFVFLCVNIDIKKALFTICCAITIQHIAVALQFICRIALIWIGLPSKIIFSSYLLNSAQILLVYAIAYFLFCKKLNKYRSSIFSFNSSMLAIFIMLPAIIILSIASRFFASKYGNDVLLICFQLFVFITCVYILWILTYQSRFINILNELVEKESIIEKQKIQFSQSKKNVEEINKKCHDLKHQISAIQRINSDKDRSIYIQEIEETLFQYDAFVKTGNETVDVVLTEKKLVCKQNDIMLSCIVDGKLLEVIDIIDLYTIMGNTLDNAIEAVKQIEEIEKRYISLKAFQYQGFLNIQIENFSLVFPTLVEGLPITTKEDSANHGYGLKSIKTCVEKYNGCITVSKRDEMFCLQILVPLTNQVIKTTV